jgi:hypothetical protein
VLPEKFEPAKFERAQTLFNTAFPEAGATLASPSAEPWCAGGCTFQTNLKIQAGDLIGIDQLGR